MVAPRLLGSVQVQHWRVVDGLKVDNDHSRVALAAVLVSIHDDQRHTTRDSRSTEESLTG